MEQLESTLSLRRNGGLPAPMEAPAWTPWLVLAGIGSVLAFVLWSGRGTAPAVDWTPTSVRFSAHGYQRTIALVSIDSVSFRRNLDGVGSRRDALQSGNTYAGSFNFAQYGTVMLFVDAGRKPIVVIHARDGVTMVSSRDSASATVLASALDRAASEARRNAAVAPRNAAGSPPRPVARRAGN